MQQVICTCTNPKPETRNPCAMCNRCDAPSVCVRAAVLGDVGVPSVLIFLSSVMSRCLVGSRVSGLGFVVLSSCHLVSCGVDARSGDTP
jgi:hypothetical protein